MTRPMLSRRVTIATVCAALLLGVFPLSSGAQKKSRAKLRVCGNPNVKCPSPATSEPYDLQFTVPRNSVIYDTELFYAVMLKSVSSPTDDCDTFIPETERLAAQKLFPTNKVFTSRCSMPGYTSYSNTSPNAQFMAVYAGRTQAEADRMLATVKATGKFPGASVRRMRAMMNGT